MINIVNLIRSKVIEIRNKRRGVIILRAPIKKYTTSTVFPNKEIMEDAFKNL